jgi:hypothetical protein
MDRNTGEIYGTLPGIYGAEEDVRFDFSTGQVVVGNTNVWYIGDKMAELAQLPATLEPTATPEQEEIGRVGLVGSHSVIMEDIPQEFLAPISPDYMRLTNDRGEQVPYGHIFRRIDLGEDIFRLEVLTRWRGIITKPTNPINAENFELGVFDIPFEEYDSSVGELVETNDKQIFLILLPVQSNFFQAHAFYGGNIDQFNTRHISFEQAYNILKDLPPGTPVVVGLQFRFDENYDKPDWFFEEERAILEAIETKTPVDSPIIFTITSIGLDSSYLNR